MLNKEKNTENYATLFIVILIIYIFISIIIKEYFIAKAIIGILFVIFFLSKKNELFKTKSYFNFAKFTGWFCLVIGSIIFLLFLAGLSRGYEFGAEWITPLLLSIFLIIAGIVYIMKFRKI